MLKKYFLLLLIFCNFSYSIANNTREIFKDDLNLDIFLIFLVFIISIITTIGGVGGGGLLIPTFMLIGNFKLEEAIPLSVVTILGDTIIRLINLYNKKHPLNEKRFLINLTPLLLIVPFDGNTSFFGVLLSEFTPKLLTIILIILTLGFTFYKSIMKAVSSFIKENKILERRNNDIEIFTFDDNDIEMVVIDDNDMKMVVIDGIAEYFPKNEIFEAGRIEGEGDKECNKYTETLILFVTILIIAIFSLTRILLNKCSTWYWLQILLQFIVVSTIGYFIIKYVSNDYETKKNNNYIFLKGDIVWSKSNIIKFVLIGSITGILSTYMGIGGGMLTTPVMIDVGMIPEVVVATSSVSTFFSSTISVINYIVSGKLLWKFGLVFATSSALGSILGLWLSNYILQKFKRQSIIIFVVSLILFTSIILLIVNAFTKYDINNFTFSNICSP